MTNNYHEHKYIWLQPECNDCEINESWPGKNSPQCPTCGRNRPVYSGISAIIPKRLTENGEVK